METPVETYNGKELPDDFEWVQELQRMFSENAGQISQKKLGRGESIILKVGEDYYRRSPGKPDEEIPLDKNLHELSQ